MGLEKLFDEKTRVKKPCDTLALKGLSLKNTFTAYIVYKIMKILN
jgi:hypothetical protein